MADRQPGVPINRRTLLGGAAVLAVGAATIGGVLFTEDRLGPWRLTARSLVDRLQSVAGGSFPGYRRNHAKGLAVSGYFESNGAGVELSSASVFRSGRYPLVGRFSLAGGNPHAPDDPATARGFGLRLQLPGGEQWRMATLSLPVFLDATPEDFYARTLAFAPDPATGKPDPATVKQYFADHPSAAAARKLVSATSPAATFEGTEFRGLNAFHFTNETGQTVPVRWVLEPDNGDAPPPSPGPDALFASLARSVSAAPLRWNLVVIEGIAGRDPTHNATLPWPEDRRRFQVGTVVIDGFAQADSTERVNFDPTVLPLGISLSDDPLLAARAAAYSESFRRRSGETAPPTWNPEKDTA